MIRHNDLLLVPHPKSLKTKEGRFTLRHDTRISCETGEKEQVIIAAKRMQQCIEDEVKLGLAMVIGKRGQASSFISFERIPHFAKEEYVLDIREDGVAIQYSTERGAFHAVSTFKQIIKQTGKSLPSLYVHDAPDFAARGIMLDISRNKIPTMETLFRLVDLMADLKLNQLQLYIEGFSFAYETFPEVWKNGMPITGEEVMRLDAYCKQSFIDLVPNQNSFGHMAAWLSRPEFKRYADSVEGFEAPWGWCNDSFSLNPLDPECLTWLNRMYEDLIPYFSSDYFNVGCDETFELGKGRSKERCDQIGKGRVYLEFLLQIHKLVQQRGKKMMFWGDIIKDYPELIAELPDDIIALEWGYDADQPSAENCEKYAQAGIPFYVCPGTSSWNSITGRTDVMKQNLLNAAKHGQTYGAIGYLITDWGDGGHWQSLPVSYAGYCYGAALSWNLESNSEMDIAAYLNQFVFQDRNHQMGQFVLDMGNYYLQEKPSTFNGSSMYRILRYDRLGEDRFLDFLNLPKMEEADFMAVKQYVEQRVELLDQAEMACDDSAWIDAEFRQAIRLILFGAEVGLWKCSTDDEQVRKQRLREFLDEMSGLLHDFRAVWLLRNRSGGLDDSIECLQEMKRQIVTALEK